MSGRRVSPISTIWVVGSPLASSCGKRLRHVLPSGGDGPFGPADRSLPQGRDEAILAVRGGGETLLDIGCGNGALLYGHRARFKTLMGPEYSPERLRQAEENLRGFDVVLHRGSAESMHMIASESVDRIVTSDVVEHIPDIYTAVGEMLRILKPRSLLVVNTPNVAYLKRRAQLLAGRFPSTSQPNEGLGSDILFDGGHLHYFTYRSLSLLLERGGFRVVGRQAYGRFGRLHSLYPPLTSVGVQVTAQK